MNKTNFLHKLIKKIDRNLSGPVSEFSEQFLYGHREALCTYAGLPNNAIIKGSIEHGWTYHSPTKGIPKFSGGRHLHLIWSSSRIPQNLEHKTNLLAIGAPFLYAYNAVKELLSDSAQLNQKFSDRTLFFPYHGSEIYAPNIDSQIRQFKKVADPTLTTAILYWTEFVNPTIRNKFNEAGFKIANLGFSGMQSHEGLGFSAKKSSGSTIGGRHLFLLNLLLLINAHRNVIVFGVGGTPALYAAFMNKEIQLLTQLKAALPKTHKLENKFEYNDENEQREVIKFIEMCMKAKFDLIDFSSDEFRKFANLQLGVNDFKSKNELYNILIEHSIMVGNPTSSEEYIEAVKKFNSLKVNVL